jgi:tetratricopeptide (TPR) repeat protein
VVEKLAGELAAAEAAFRSALQLYLEYGSVGYASSLAAELAGVLVEQGRDEEALQLTEFSERNAAADDKDAQARWRGARGRVLADRELFEDAVRLAQEAAQIASATEWLSLHADSLIDLAVVLRLAGRSGEAVSLINQALRLYERKGNVVGAARSTALLEPGRMRSQRAPTRF